MGCSIAPGLEPSLQAVEGGAEAALVLWKEEQVPLSRNKGWVGISVEGIGD